MWQIVEKDRKGKAGMFIKFSELACQCKHKDCNMLLTYSPAILSFNNTRHNFGRPILVTSGHRCQKHNADVGGVDDSFHMRGQAHDLAPLYTKDMSEDDKKALLKELARTAKRYYSYTQIYYEQGFVHCHKL